MLLDSSQVVPPLKLDGPPRQELFMSIVIAPIHRWSQPSRLRRLCLVLIAAILVIDTVFAGTIPFRDANGLPTLAPMLEEVTPAVVNISVYTAAPEHVNPLFRDPFFRRFFNLPNPARRPPRQSAGSGVIVDANNGYVLTNHHLLERAQKVIITLKDRRRFEARVLGSDQGTDIAVLQIDANGLTALPIGNSKSLQVGDFVVAIGNPFGLGQTVTSGIVSALGRSGLILKGYEDFIQTDASINPGNSGGALVSLDGNLVGINTALIGPTGGNVGIGFAVPMHIAIVITDQIIKYGEVRRGRMGIMIQDLTPNLAASLELDWKEGALISRIEPDSPAAGAGLRIGDVITAINGDPVRTVIDLRNTVGLVRVNSYVDVVYVRNNRQRQVKVQLTASNLHSYADLHPPLAGARLRNLEPDDRYYDSIDAVLIAEIDHNSPAWRNGLRSGDRLVAINRRRVRDLDQVEQMLNRSDGVLLFAILRDSERLLIVID